MPGQQGCGYDELADEVVELCDEERELAMGLEASTTAAPGISDGTRCALLCHAIEVNTLFMLVQAALCLHELGIAAPAQSKRRHAQQLAVHPPVAPRRLAVMLPLNTPEEQVEQATRAAFEAGSDVWLDTELMAFLHLGPAAQGQAASKRVLRRAKSYVYFNNRLYRTLADTYTGQVVHRQVPEPHARDQLILDCHVSLGHLGEKRTIAAMTQTYWWYGITVDIRRVLSGCKLCARVHASSGETPRDMITEMASLYGMFHRWGLDYAQGLPASAGGFIHCLIIIDYYSKWIEAIPTRDLFSATTAQLFHLHICARFGLPAEVITDGGTAFRGAFHELCLRKLIHHRVISEDLPRSNGLAERAVQTVKAALRKHCADKHNALTWDTEALPSILLGYRCTPQAATGHSPARILFALDPVLDAEQHLSRQGPIDYTADVPVDQLAAQLLERSRLAAEIGASVAHNIRTAHERDSRRFRARRSGLYVPRLHHFSVGDYVFVLSQGQKPGGSLGIRARNEVLKVIDVRLSGVLVLQNQAGRTVDKHFEHCAPCMLPNLLGDTYAGLVKPHADSPCQVCHDHNHQQLMLLCDNCDSGWHTYCLNPPLEDVPEGVWLCPDCTAAGVTPASLAHKEQQLVQDTESRPNLELPSRRRIARARQYADTWHGKIVSHTRGGTTRHGRVCFQGVLHTKWFLIFWSDGTSSEHNASLLRHLCIVDEAAIGVQLPQVPPATVLWTRAVDASGLTRHVDPQSVVRALTVLMGGPECDPMLSLEIHEAIVQTGTAVRAYEQRSLECIWPALERILPLGLVGSCFLPVSEGRYLLPQLLARGLTCFDNHPCPAAAATLHLDPFVVDTYQQVADAGFAEVVWVACDPHLLDYLLPLAYSHAGQLVVAAVPNDWLAAHYAHRVLWLHDEIWRHSLGLIVHVHTMPKLASPARVQPYSWLFLFASRAARDRFLGGRVPDHCTECVWRQERPYQLHFLSSLPSAHWRIFRRPNMTE